MSSQIFQRYFFGFPDCDLEALLPSPLPFHLRGFNGFPFASLPVFLSILQINVCTINYMASNIK